MSTYEHTKNELEAMMDGGHTVADLLGMIAHVCEDKAEFVTSGENGQTPDKPYGKAYMTAAMVLTRACAQLGRKQTIKLHQI